MTVRSGPPDRQPDAARDALLRRCSPRCSGVAAVREDLLDLRSRKRTRRGRPQPGLPGHRGVRRELDELAGNSPAAQGVRS
ncbi:hypothetical protein HBB16_00325 [Pseudonocardia sp. MCCB 268]|nr:hypothetical protein [Pseudonocardia cytotoxica]